MLKEFGCVSKFDTLDSVGTEEDQKKKKKKKKGIPTSSDCHHYEILLS